MRPALLLATLPAAIAAAAPAAPAERLYAGGNWAALRFGTRCDAIARPLPPSRNREQQARAGFAFDTARGRNGQFYVRLSRIPRDGASVILTMGSQPFLLVARGPWAWSRGAAQDVAIMAAARTAGSMRVESRDGAGRRFADRYLLRGAPTAIDAAAAGCAGKI